MTSFSPTTARRADLQPASLSRIAGGGDATIVGGTFTSLPAPPPLHWWQRLALLRTPPKAGR